MSCKYFINKITMKNTSSCYLDHTKRMHEISQKKRSFFVKKNIGNIIIIIIMIIYPNLRKTYLSTLFTKSLIHKRNFKHLFTTFSQKNCLFNIISIDAKIPYNINFMKIKALQKGIEIGCL